MSAQPGGSILLQYGAPGVQQPGGTILLSYDSQTAATSTMVWNSTVGRWQKSATKRRSLDSRYVAVSRLDDVSSAPWVASEGLSVEDSAAWVPPAKVDTGSESSWSSAGVSLNGDRKAGWRTSISRDDRRTSLFGAYGEMLNEDQRSRWKGSKAVDSGRKVEWTGFFIPTYRPIPYIRPDALSANFTVVGGAPMQIVLSVPTEANQLLPIDAQFGAELYGSHYFGDPLRRYIPPTGKAANFNIDIAAARELVLDGQGQPVLSGANRDSVRLNPWGKGKRIDDATIIPWLRFSRPLNPGWGVVTPGGPTPPEPGETITIPVQRVYIVVNDILLVRADDSTPIPATAMSIQFDCDSWLPAFSATILETSRDAVMPDPNPVEVLAYINGSEFRFFVEKIARNRKFGERTVSISGRALACELDAPYAEAAQHTNGSTMNAQQIINAALQYTTYTQTWGITDWSVPANAFSMFGTPAEVAGAVAEASGSVLQADWALRNLRMLPRYPVKPWDWAAATPEYVIPSAITETESVEWIEKPAYNVVYVSGVQTGIIGQVKITGTAGDKPAPMVTNPLITHVDAARQRGISILGDTGRKAMMQISMPVLPATGVIDVCRLIEFSDGANTRRGIVRANQISVNWPTVRQTLTIEASV